MNRKESAVSPVVGVMLMLVVTIIIAAVVATFAGGLINSQSAAPSGSFEASLTPDSLEIKVLGVSEPVPSKDLQISLIKSDGKSAVIKAGAENASNLFGFNIVEAGEGKGFHDFGIVGAGDLSTSNAAHSSNSVQWFGNYTIKAGSVMSASGNAFKSLAKDVKTYSKSGIYGESGATAAQWTAAFTACTNDNTAPAGYGAKNYVEVIEGAEIGSQLADCFNAEDPSLVGTDGKTTKTTYWWYKADNAEGFAFKSKNELVFKKDLALNRGDKVTVIITHLPSAQIIFSKDITVKEA